MRANGKHKASKRLAPRLVLYCAIAASSLIRILHAQDFQYAITNGSITITNYVGPGGNLAIPANIDGLPVRTIGGQAFEQKNLTAITIPDTVTNIEDGFWMFGAFALCSALTNVNIGNSVLCLGDGTFRACTSLTRVSVPDSVTTVGQYAFFDCWALSHVKFGTSVAAVGNGMFGYAFAFCTNLTSVVMAGQPPLGVNVFDTCSNVTVYYLPGTSGWGPTYAGRPTMLWNPQVQTTEGSFGVQQNRFGFNIAGTPDIPLVVEGSADLAATSWIPLQTCNLTNGLLYFSDPQWTNYSARFYRIQSP